MREEKIVIESKNARHKKIKKTQSQWNNEELTHHNK